MKRTKILILLSVLLFPNVTFAQEKNVLEEKGQREISLSRFNECCRMYWHNREEIYFIPFFANSLELGDYVKCNDYIYQFYDEKSKVERICLEDTTKEKYSNLYRISKPIYIFAGLDGFGAGLTLFGMIDFQSSIPLFQHMIKVKLFYPFSNSSPYIGYGVGAQFPGFGGGDERNKWRVLIFGWHFYPFDQRGFYEFSLQYTLSEENKKAFYPTVISFSVGVRIF